MTLSPNKRILLNIIATYGRSLFALICGILTGRWALMTLGRVDLGLYGVVGGLTAFIGFFNGLMGGAVSRFYAYSVGIASKNYQEGIDECRKWFNTALMIHTVVPALLIAIGYPIGSFAIRHWLTIPADRIDACIWVFRFSCVTCFAGMVSIPYNAMYRAKQYIAELTIYSFASTIFHVCILYYMLTHPGVWLTKYALCNCIFGLMPTSIICLRAIYLFPECKFELHYLWNGERILKIVNFAGWQFFGGCGSLLRNQGIAILVNKYFGPAVNASNTIANNLAGHTLTLSSSLSGAFGPAITNACGAKDFERMRTLAWTTCKIGTLLVLIFALPLMLEIHEVLRIWLKEPPEYVDILCLCVIVRLILDRISYGHMQAVNAMGKIALYQAVLGTTLILTLPIAWLGVVFGGGVKAVGYAMIFTMVLISIGRAWFARRLTGMSAKYWLKKIVFPLLITSCLVLSCGGIVRLFMSSSFIRVCMTTIVCNVVLFISAWFFLLDLSEKNFILSKLTRYLKKWQ